MNQNEDLFQYQISKAMETYRHLLANKVYPFDLKWDKQVIMFILLATTFCKQKQHKQAVLFMHACKPVIDNFLMTEEVQPRDLDFQLATRVMSAFVLLRNQKLDSAIKNLVVAERLLGLLIRYNLEEQKTPQTIKYLKKLKILKSQIDEAKQQFKDEILEFEERSREEELTDEQLKAVNDRIEAKRQQLRSNALNKLKQLGPPPQVDKSAVSITLIQNYILAIYMMKNICLKFLCMQNPTPLNQAVYRQNMRDQVTKLSEIEAIMILKRQQTLSGINEFQTTHCTQKAMVVSL